MGVQGPCEEVNEQTEGRVLIRHQLNLHSPELHSPPDVIIDGYLEASRIPVSAVEHIEQSYLVIRHRLELLVHNQNVPFENVGNVLEQITVYVYF